MVEGARPEPDNDPDAVDVGVDRGLPRGRNASIFPTAKFWHSQNYLDWRRHVALWTVMSTLRFFLSGFPSPATRLRLSMIGVGAADRGIGVLFLLLFAFVKHHMQL